RCIVYHESFFPGFFLIQRIWAQVGIYKKPSLSAQPSTLVKNGGKVTLQCCSEVMFETFIFVLHRQKVTKDLLNLSGESYDGGSQANVSIDPLTPVHAGTYRCYGSLNHQPYVWSEPSDPLDIVITGEYQFKKPSISAQPDFVVRSGENVTLSCSSDSSFGMYHLSREGEPQGHCLPAVQSHSGTFQADFPLGPVTHKGTYRCYGSFNGSPYAWSSPSDPLHLSVNPPHLTLFYKVVFSHATQGCVHIPHPTLASFQEAEGEETEEVTQEVTYTELDHWVYTWKKITPTSQRLKESPTETSMYMELVKC
uniref:Immunoglobulin domain-containing protein n=1 Tax=Castor canadensis TaxID=51338 RepID=A0A8C0WIE9_CASCN